MDLPPEVVRQACAQRVAEHARAQRERGLVRCTIWVPAAERERLTRYAAQLRAEAGVPLPTDPPPKPKKKAAKKTTAKQKPKKRRSPGKERRYQRRKAERAARSN